MILPRYHIAASAIHGAGNGLFLDETVAAGSIITAPDAITQTFRYADIMASAQLRAQFAHFVANLVNAEKPSRDFTYRKQKYERG